MERGAAVAPTKNTDAEPTRQKRRRSARAATQTQALWRTPDALAAALEGVPAEDWERTWPSCRTIILRRTSTTAEKLDFLFMQLPLMAVWPDLVVSLKTMVRRRGEFEDNAKGTVVYYNACNNVCFAEYRDARVFDKYASNLIDQKNIRVRALKALISSECQLRIMNSDPASLEDSLDMDWEDMWRRRCEFEDNAKGTVVYDNACNSVWFTEYRDARVGYLHPYVGDDHLRSVRTRAWVQACMQIGQGTELTVSYGHDYWDLAALQEEGAEERYFIACMNSFF